MPRKLCKYEVQIVSKVWSSLVLPGVVEARLFKGRSISSKLPLVKVTKFQEISTKKRNLLACL